MVSSFLFLSMPGGTEWILIVLAVLILFGGRKIPEFMRGLGKGMREFKDAKDNVKSEIEAGLNDPPRSANTNNTTSTNTTATPNSVG